MKTDRFVKFFLLVIAVSLGMIALRPYATPLRLWKHNPVRAIPSISSRASPCCARPMVAAKCWKSGD